jgi:radical SAM-linked protein
VAPDEFRLRIRYRKSGRLRFLSHLEIVRAMERGIRRAQLPYAVTHGFNPRIKAGFGPALPVGTASEAEYLDVWLTRYTPAKEALEQLTQALPEGLQPTEAAYVPEKTGALTAGGSAADYVVGIATEGVDPERLQAAVDSLVATGTLSVEHKGKTKVFDLSRALRNEPRVEVAEDGSAGLSLGVRIGQEGSLRPDVFATAAFARAGIPSHVASVTRIDFSLLDQEGKAARPI